MKHAITILAIGLTLSSCSRLQVERTFRPHQQDWTLMGGSPTRANVTTASLTPPLEEVWEYNALAGISASPLVRDSVVIIATLNGEVQAVNFVNGKRLGYVVLESSIAGTPVLDNSAVIIPLAGGGETLISLSLRTSEHLWKARIGPIESSLLVYGEFVYATTLEGRVYCLRKNDGTVVWKFSSGTDERRKPIRSSPTTDGQTIFFGCDDGFLYAVERTSGTLRWKFDAGASVFASPIVANDAVLFGTLGGKFFCLDTANGTLRWTFDTASPIYGMAAVNDQAVFVGASNGVCYALDVPSGTKLWQFSTRSVVNSPPLVAGNLLYWGSMDRTLYVLDTRTGRELWKYTARGRIRVPPVIWGTFLLVTSEDKFVVALRPTP
jgi:outer membrane protein assembly factor BamB